MEKFNCVFTYRNCNYVCLWNIFAIDFVDCLCDTYPRFPQTRVLYLSPSEFLSPLFLSLRLLFLWTFFYQHDRHAETEKSYWNEFVNQHKERIKAGMMMYACVEWNNTHTNTQINSVSTYSLSPQTQTQQTHTSTHSNVFIHSHKNTRGMFMALRVICTVRNQR